AVIVLDESVDLVRVAWRLAHFYAHESCGQCTPCREGTGWLARILDRIVAGQGTKEDIQVLEDAAEHMAGRTICALADGAAAPVLSLVRLFPEELHRRVMGKAA
ncbi:MAG: NADH-quinone oxidoreductase subunit F, partial [Zetaproteobacteria bacterium]